MTTAALHRNFSVITEISPDMGKTPAVILENPKFAHNGGSVLRAASILGVRQLLITGTRMLDVWEERGRLPREERMRVYGNVEVIFTDRPFDAFPRGTTFVGVEVQENAEVLAYFEHPENPVYVFGPEDGSLSKSARGLIHRFLILPTDGCMNLSHAVSNVLMHRRLQRQLSGKEEVRPSYQTTTDQRGFLDDDSPLS